MTANLAAQLVVDNPTDVPLEVLGATGQPFLRISRAGVFGNLGSPDFYATATPNGGPDRGSGADRFVQISGGSSWGWYDHRLHPVAVTAPADLRRMSRLASFEVPLRYGAAATTVRGHLEYRPLLGQFDDTITSVPTGLTASVLQGRLPGLFVTVTAAMTVLGRDGEPFVRSDGRALSVNTASRTYVEDQQARGVAAGPPAVTPRWRALPGRTFTWLDERLRFPSAAPPPAALKTAAPSTVGTWTIPVSLPGSTTALRGQMRWVPAADARPAAEPTRRPWVPIGCAALVLIAAAAVVRRRRTRACLHC
ncbi:MAG: hypothetical protein NVS3B26_12990 [Mycobacteriales bacterium]